MGFLRDLSWLAALSISLLGHVVQAGNASFTGPGLIRPYSDPYCRIPVNSTYDGVPTLPDGSPDINSPAYYQVSSDSGILTTYKNADFENATFSSTTAGSYMVWWKIGNIPATCRVAMAIPYTQNHWGHTDREAYPQLPGLVIWNAQHAGCIFSMMMPMTDVMPGVCCDPDCVPFAVGNTALSVKRDGQTEQRFPVDVSMRDQRYNRTDEEDLSLTWRDRRRSSRLARDEAATISSQPETEKIEAREAAAEESSPELVKVTREITDEAIEDDASLGLRDLEHGETPASAPGTPTKRHPKDIAPENTESDLSRRQNQTLDANSATVDLSGCNITGTIGPWAEPGYQTMVANTQTCAPGYSRCFWLVDSTLTIGTSVGSSTSQKLALKAGYELEFKAGKVKVEYSQDVAKSFTHTTGREMISKTTYDVANRLGQPFGTTGFVTFTPVYECYSGHLDCGQGPSPEPFYICYPTMSTNTNTVAGEYNYVILS